MRLFRKLNKPFNFLLAQETKWIKKLIKTVIKQAKMSIFKSIKIKKWELLDDIYK